MDEETVEPVRKGPGPGGVVPRDEYSRTVVPPVRCRAHTSSGKPCKRWAIVGGFVCATHGGTAPQVRRKANERILALAPRAAQIIAALAEGSQSDVVRLRAAQDILDRGLGKAVDLTLDLTPQDATGGPSALDLRIAEALDARGLGTGDQDVVDAEVIDPETGADQGEHTPDEGPPHT
jgi:hypothetical protein